MSAYDVIRRSYAGEPPRTYVAVDALLSKEALETSGRALGVYLRRCKSKERAYGSVYNETELVIRSAIDHVLDS